MIKETKEAISLALFLRKHWENPFTLLTLLCFIVTAGLALAYRFDLSELKQAITGEEIVAVVAVALIALLAWWLTTRLPKTPEGMIGIGIAIDCETKKERQRLKSDFVRTLQDEIRRGNQQHYHVFELSEYLATKVKTHKDAMKYLIATDSHLMVYGNCRIRTHEGKPTYVLELNESIRHALIPIEISRQFSHDMDLAFPKKALIPESEELTGFELTRELMGLASRYTLGIASALSGNSFAAFDLHLGVWNELKDRTEREKDDFPIFKNLYSRTASFLVQEGLTAANSRFTKKPTGYLDDMQKYLGVVQTIDPNHYGAHLLRGIYYFLQSRDVENAKKEIKKAKNERDAAWLWSSAFLEAYEGRLEEAHKIYQRAFRASVTDDTPLQVETFIADVLSIEPDKIQLWYCLGMINYLYKRDLISAKRDFEKFVELATSSGKFARSIDFAKKYLAGIDEKLRKEKK